MHDALDLGLAVFASGLLGSQHPVGPLNELSAITDDPFPVPGDRYAGLEVEGVAGRRVVFGHGLYVASPGLRYHCKFDLLDNSAVLRPEDYDRWLGIKP